MSLIIKNMVQLKKKNKIISLEAHVDKNMEIVVAILRQEGWDWAFHFLFHQMMSSDQSQPRLAKYHQVDKTWKRFIP